MSRWNRLATPPGPSTKQWLGLVPPVPCCVWSRVCAGTGEFPGLLRQSQATPGTALSETQTRGPAGAPLPQRAGGSLGLPYLRTCGGAQWPGRATQAGLRRDLSAPLITLPPPATWPRREFLPLATKALTQRHQEMPSPLFDVDNAASSLGFGLCSFIFISFITLLNFYYLFVSPSLGHGFPYHTT